MNNCMKIILLILALILSESLSLGQTTYIWSGAVNSNFSAAGNWSPVRQVGLSSDILIFNSGATVNAINVNQVTIGQLIITNNTQVKLSPTSGNPKVISIEGNGDSPGGSGNVSQTEMADIKYDEYKIYSDTTDLATQKYSEYMKDSLESGNDIATIKYSEYKKPVVNGMGDIKKSEEEFDENTNEDLKIEAGSSLTINGNDPKLSIYLKQNATAAIQGSLTFTGEAQHTINSFDTYAITIHEGAELVQSCPGKIFTETGANNSAYFEDGSSFIINHSGTLDPFGAGTPSSKVIFSDSSNIKFNANLTTPLNISGRGLPNITVNTNITANINIQDNENTNVDVTDIIVNQGGKLNINNTVIHGSNLNIKGNISVYGELHITYNKIKGYNLNFSGTSPQSISGSGVIDISKAIEKIKIYNDLTFNRDLTVYSHVSHFRGSINTNGHIFRIYNQYSSKQMIFVGIVIVPPDYGEEGSGGDNMQSNLNNASIPASFSISQNYPNPFNPKTKINYALPKSSSVKITVYDLSGQEVASLVNGNRESSFYTAEFDGSNYASGVYFYRINAIAGNGEIFNKTLKMVLTK